MYALKMYKCKTFSKAQKFEEFLQIELYLATILLYYLKLLCFLL